MLGATKNPPKPRLLSQGDEERATHPIAQGTLVLVLGRSVTAEDRLAFQPPGSPSPAADALLC